VTSTVLVIEDETDIGELIKLNLELDGHRVLLAGDGAAGLSAARGDHPDLILLDVMMPAVDGWQVLTTLKADPDESLSSIPVLMLTARADPLDKLRGEIEGVIRY
jgi:two-component system alkaline phosphatase synthesis response regulator PhoP